jgi:predicted Zn-dependent peptidase
LATALAIYQARFGDWRELFRQVDKIDKVTKADIRRVANTIFVPENRTVGILQTRKPAAATKGGQQ